MTTFAYDLAGRTLTVTDPSGAVVSTVYDAAGQVTATIDPSWHTTSGAADGNGSVVGSGPDVSGTLPTP